MSAFTRTLFRAAPRVATPARTFGSSPSRSYARMTVTGRLGAEPELRATNNGSEMIRYNIASKSTNPKDGKNADWFRITSFADGPSRDFLLALPKGTLVCVDAEATWRTFTDSEGSEKTTLSLTQRHIEVLRRPYNPDGPTLPQE
ncbi:hypothetical protein BJY04DRAFT_182897 [Aspergillus karnatakaensis]|uniref:single-stranded DNA-binding protein n=1 Tax=Aspergillus karnatakaensis TaxID=1810916 RepID=UPI003CCCA442